MGSGSSKEKSDTGGRTDRSEKQTARQQNISNNSQKSDNVANPTFRNSDTGKKLQNSVRNNDKNVNNNNNNKTKGRIPQPFNDSDDDADDILRDEWKNPKSKNGALKTNGMGNYSNNTAKTWEPPQPPTEEYPETYAQKMQREQYKQEQMLRQKTIYRDPDEWKVEEQGSMQSFDVGKFKEANRMLPKTDIFGPISHNDYSYSKNVDDDTYYSVNHNRKKSVPRYDVTEEELMNDIESHFH